MKSCLTLIMLALAFTANVQARPHRPRPIQPPAPSQTLEIEMYGKEFQGQSTIFLKQEIQRFHPRIDFSNWDLKRVVLVAKSARGYGSAYLQTGRDQSRVETVDGNPRDFRGNGNYHRVSFPAPGGDNGVWQIHMQGNIKVNKVLVVAERKLPRRPMVTRTCGYVLETIWGKDIKKFRAEATGPEGSGVQAQACQKAYNQCNRLQDEIPLTQCNKL